MVFPNITFIQVRCIMEPRRVRCASAVFGIEITDLPVAQQKMSREQSIAIA